MNKTKIEWCDMTWNPVTGCLHNCPYCYAKRQANRFAGHFRKSEKQIHNLNEPEYEEIEHYDNGCASIMASLTPPEVELRRVPWPFGFEPTFHRYRLEEPQLKKKPENIFVCSMADLFGEWVPDEWIYKVFDACNRAPQHRYFFLTKNPDRYYQLGDGDDSIIPEGGVQGYMGASACTEKQAQKAWENLNCSWMSLEPLHGEFGEEFFTHDNRYTQDVEPRWLWIVVGAETGNRKGKVIPKREWVGAIVNECRRNNIPVFMKDNLADIWGEPLIQEYPWEIELPVSSRGLKR